MRLVTLPRKTTISSTARMLSRKMPPVKASRSPRKAKRRGHEAVPGEDAQQPREVGEGGVGGQDQQQRGRDLDEVEEGAVADEGAGELADDRRLLGGIGQDAQLSGQEAHPQEDRREGCAHEDQDDLGVARLGRFEGWHAVGDRLGAGQGDRPRGEGAQDEQEAERLACRAPPATRPGPCTSGRSPSA